MTSVGCSDELDDLACVPIEVCIESRVETVKPTFDRVEACVHPRGERVDSGVDRGTDRIDPGAQVEQGAERRSAQ